MSEYAAKGSLDQWFSALTVLQDHLGDANHPNAQAILRPNQDLANPNL